MRFTKCPPPRPDAFRSIGRCLARAHVAVRLMLIKYYHDLLLSTGCMFALCLQLPVPPVESFEPSTAASPCVPSGSLHHDM